jgi:hypothetical protein
VPINTRIVLHNSAHRLVVAAFCLLAASRQAERVDQRELADRLADHARLLTEQASEVRWAGPMWFPFTTYKRRPRLTNRRLPLITDEPPGSG